jgi:hypothetical protein
MPSPSPSPSWNLVTTRLASRAPLPTTVVLRPSALQAADDGRGLWPYLLPSRNRTEGGTMKAVRWLAVHGACVAAGWIVTTAAIAAARGFAS